MYLTEREEIIFKTIVKEYIKNAVPISSQYVLEIANLNLSPATIRNVMAGLERKGLITQPYTSAGRVPTELGYQVYIKNFLEEKDLNKRYKNKIIKYLQGFEVDEDDYILKLIVKNLSDISGVLSFISDYSNSFYFTGLSNLLSQPEFYEYEQVYSVSKIIDSLEDCIEEFFIDFNKDIEIYIGKQNPLNKNCSILLSGFTKDNKRILLGLIGPLRMDYERNIALLKFVKEFLEG